MISDSPEILLVTTSADAASDAVASALSRAGAKYLRIDTERFPLDSRSSTWTGADTPRTNWSDAGLSDLSGLRSVWLRRHRLPVLANMLPAHAEYSLRESDWYLKGVLFAIHAARRNVSWMSKPTALWEAESKLRQLQAAVHVSLECPPTLVSNDPEDIRCFFARHRSVVAKPLKLGYFDYGDTQSATFTTTITADALADDSALVAAPVIYQPNVPKQFDVRVTIVGDQVFAATIDSQAEPTAKTDWRQTASDLAHERHSLPMDVERSCLQLMRELDLAFGALDFVLTPDGRYVFLEINPNGQWLWIEDKLGFPITESVASWLMEANG